MSTSNPVLDELRSAREKILADCQGDTANYLHEAQLRLEQSGRIVWHGQQRKVQHKNTSKQTEPNQNSVPLAG